MGSKTSSTKVKEELQKEGDRLGAESVLFEESENALKAEYFDCSDKYKQRPKEWYVRRSDGDFSVFGGRYIQRDGILKKLGRMGPTLGVEFAKFSDRDSQHGFFFTWTYDHFWKTNGNLLKPEFDDQNYTNYMAGGGYAFRVFIHERVQFHYRGGLAFNFLEIDTFRENGDNDDEKYTDITVSTIHRAGIDFLLTKSDRRVLLPKPQIRIGPSLFYYWAPDPIGKFRLTKESESSSPGGSLSLALNIVFEFY